jgi:hypothetical protein
MILRRVMAHVKAQNWTAIGIDFFIVVFGVFLGIQLGLWNDARHDRANAREYRERLITDMELSVERNQTQIEHGRRQIEQLDLVLASLNSCRLNADDAGVFGAGLYNMGKFDLPTMIMGTIDELNVTGDFELIGDPELRRTISDTVRAYQTEYAIEPQLTGRIVPHVNYVRPRVRFVLEEDVFLPPSIDADHVFYDLRQLCADREFINAVAAVREMTLATNNLNRGVRERQANLLTALRAEQ